MHYVILTKLFLFSLIAFAAEEIRSYAPRHRTPEEILPMARSLFSGQMKAEVFGQKIIVNASPQTHAAFEKFLAEVDKKARSLQISMRIDGAENSLQQERSASVNTQTGPVRVRVGSTNKLNNVQVGGVGFHGQERELSRSNQGNQTLQLVEGGSAVLRMGIKPFQEGMAVKPRLSADGKNAHIELWQAKNGTGMRTQELETSVSGRTGEWIPVGSVQDEGAQNTSVILGKQTGQNKSSRRIWLKVERLP